MILLLVDLKVIWSYADAIPYEQLLMLLTLNSEWYGHTMTPQIKIVIQVA
jgi:hypothetical protein